MHRIEGDDAEINGNGAGRDGYRDATPPSIAATILTAEAMNAIQEEICLVIENCGLTLNASASADRAAVWGQLDEAIFESNRGTTDMLALNSVDGDRLIDASVENAKIVSMDFDKVTGELSQTLVSGGDNLMEIGFNEIKLHLNTAASTDYTIKVNRTDGFSHLIDSPSGFDFQTALSGHGLGFFGDPKLADKQVAFTSANFSNSSNRAVAYIDSGVPVASYDPIDATVSYEDLITDVGYDAPHRYAINSGSAYSTGPRLLYAKFTAKTGSANWQLILVFSSTGFYTDTDTNYLDKKALVKFRKV
jgi:hypothetical protein